ncbi:DUF4352 domain-containing protein [Enterococcus pallens]|uniref:DUF4352 domain-containing protein n=1 Tax=Enterococcus pallens ATCC BAA-351 TaxID=1158607 RepID=R2SC84_9ENTE|nr:DUF4352 domain-containing protein [Enterococcus pallens]EOH93140.1 hypothetical protein UAU_02783 [Enterococcus pallens ATCC BAA-351]EOU24926.1 hypothetical protein I588_00914 [Enterococcus pallens ATCC BAA-351]OJG76468.1 hypothetical protein RV10_GL003709 [Enterococcus pallens]
MAKKRVTGEDGKTYVVKEKKPFYKRVWFWILAIIVVIIVIGGLGGESEDQNTSNNNNGGTKVSSSTSTSKSNESADTQFYNLGETVKVGDAEYTLHSATLTDERNQFADTEPAQVVMITYTVKNNGDTDLPVGVDVEVYGSDNKKAETYPNENTMGSVAPGKEMDCTAHFTLNQPGEIEVHFSPLISFEKAAKFKVTV